MPRRRLALEIVLIAAVSALGGAGLAQPGPAPAPATTPPVAGDEVLPIYAGKHILVMLKVGDHAPAPVVFDTGSENNLLDTGFAKALGLRDEGPAHVIDGATGKAIPAFTATLNGATLGGIGLAAGPVEVFDYAEPDEVGVFGPNSFPGRLVALEFSKSRIRLMAKTLANTPAGPSYPYLGKPGAEGFLPAIDVQLPGMTVRAALDTGNTGALLSLPAALAHKLPLDGPLAQVATARSAGGDQPIYQGRLKGVVRIGPLTLTDPLVDFFGQGANVGLPLIRKMSLVLDPGEGRTWVLRAPVLSAPALQAYAGRYGPRTVSVQGGRLMFQRDGQPRKRLTPVSPDLFELQGSDVLLRFQRTHGRVTGFEQILEDGSRAPSQRTG